MQVKTALKFVSERSGLSITDLLSTTTLKDTIIPRTSRNSPLNVQIGRMDALAFCLRLQPPLREFVPSKVRFIVLVCVRRPRKQKFSLLKLGVK